MSSNGRIKKWVMPVAAGALLLAVWCAIKMIWHLKSFVLPWPSEIIPAAIHERATLLSAALSTMGGALVGFLAAGILGFLLAALLGSAKWVRQALYPYVLLVQMFPVIVLAPVFVLWLGQGLPSVAVITFIIGFFPVVANTTRGMISVDQSMVDLFRMANTSRWQEVVFLRIPYALPYFMTGLRIAASLAMIGAISGEFFAGSAGNGGTGGLGFLVIVYFSQLKTPELFATGFVACLCGFIFVSAVLLLDWLLLHKWHESIDRTDK